MVDWRDPGVVALCGYVFGLVTVFFLGFTSWYVALTLSRVEAPLLFRKMKFKYAHIPYLSARYCLLTSLFVLVVSSNIKGLSVACKGTGFLRTTAVLGNLAVVSASTNLVMRALVLWRDARVVVCFLIVVCIAHAALAVAMGVGAAQKGWDPERHICLILNNKAQHLLLSFYSFTLSWDIMILVLTIIGLRRHRLSTNSTLWSILVTQGIGYMIITCISCIPVLAFVALNLNDPLNVLFTAPGGVMSVITSCACVTSLQEITNDRPRSSADPEVQSPSAPDLRKTTEAVTHPFTSHIDLLTTADCNMSEANHDQKTRPVFCVESAPSSTAESKTLPTPYIS